MFATTESAFSSPILATTAATQVAYRPELLNKIANGTTAIFNNLIKFSRMLYSSPALGRSGALRSAAGIRRLLNLKHSQCQLVRYKRHKLVTPSINREKVRHRQKPKYGMIVILPFDITYKSFSCSQPPENAAQGGWQTSIAIKGLH
jgi:hypothetical protein